MSDDDDGWDEWWALSEKEDRAEAELLQIECVGFHWMEPLQNFAIGSTIYEWFRLEREFDNVVISPCGRPFWGPLPDWYEVEETSLLEQMDIGHHEWDVVTFGIQEGISPGQPFLVEFKEPTWQKTSYEYDEWDVDYHWRVVRRMPKTVKAAGLSWDRTLKRIDTIKKAKVKHKQYYDILKFKLTKHWAIEVHHWPGRLGLYLKANIPRMPFDGHLACGQSDPGQDVALAFKKLLEDFRSKYPGVDVGPILRLAHTKLDIRLNQWEILRVESAAFL